MSYGSSGIFLEHMYDVSILSVDFGKIDLIYTPGAISLDSLKNSLHKQLSTPIYHVSWRRHLYLLEFFEKPNSFYKFSRGNEV